MSGFSGDGVVRTNFTRRDDFASAVALQSDGKIVVAGGVGVAFGPPERCRFGFARYNVDGTLDSTFGSDGKVTVRFSRHCDIADGVALQLDGKIVAAGVSAFDGRNPRFALVRLNQDGTLDTSFGGDGKVRTDFSQRHRDVAYAVSVLASGRIVAAGGTGVFEGKNSRFAIARYMPDGSRDTSFGGDGRVRTNFSRKDDSGNALAVQANGKMVVAGFAGSFFHGTFALARYNVDGSLDQSFGSAGKIRTDFGLQGDMANGLAIQANGRIVAGGSTGVGDIGTRFAVARYLTNGHLDPSFSNNGKASTDVTKGADNGNAVALDPGGGIFLTGSSGVGVRARYATVKYLG